MNRIRKWLWNIGESYYLENGWEILLSTRRKEGFSLLEILGILLLMKPLDDLANLIRIKPEEEKEK